MSHLTTYVSENLVNTKKSLLSRALKDLGLEIDYSIKTVKNSWITESVDAGFIKNGRPISVGIKLIKEGNKTKIEVAGDFYNTGIDQRTFIDKLSQMYKKYDVIQQCLDQGWAVDMRDIYIDKKTDEVVIQASRYTA